MSFRLRVYDPQNDEPIAYRLWTDLLGHRWPLTRATFARVTHDNPCFTPTACLVAEVGGAIVGFIAAQVRRIPDEHASFGQITVLLIDPAFQGRGIGRDLLETALARLRSQGVNRVQLGGGCCCYFWPGVPLDLEGAVSFFKECGWTVTEASIDLVRTLHDYITPAEVAVRIRDAGVTLDLATPDRAEEILAFEREHFPRWLQFFAPRFENGESEGVLVARDRSGRVVGTSLVLLPFSSENPDGFVWQDLLGPKTGGIGALGVREDFRGRGIGLGLAARTTELLRDRGLASSYVGWTWLVDWYGKLGYRVWREYAMSWRNL